MPVRASMVGAELGTREFEATPRRLLAYAAALGVTGGSTFDDASAAFAALPQFCVVAEWPWASDLARLSELGLDAGEAARALHLGQDSTFHRPIRPGARLRVGGRLEEVRAVRSGALTVSGIEITDATTGERLVSSRSTALFQGVGIEGEPRALDVRPGEAPVPWLASEALIEEESLSIARGLGHVYTECAGIWNPIHTERRVALAMGLPDIVLHGTATWAIAGRELVQRYGAGDHGRLRRLAGAFRAMVVPGTTIRIRHCQPAGSEGATTVRFAVLNAAGETAIADGLAEFAAA